MVWIKLIIFIVAGVLWLLKQRKQAQQGSPAPHKEAAFEDPELAERTRRIREEIQRKIEQRTRAYTQPQPPAVRPEAVAPPLVIREAGLRPPQLPPSPKVAAARLEAQRTAEIIEQQAALTEQLRQVDEMKAAAMQRTQFETHVSSSAMEAAVARSALTDDLRNPEALRRAFILREIIGPPVALRS